MELRKTENSLQIQLRAQAFRDSDNQQRSFLGVLISKPLFDNGVRDAQLGAAQARVDAARSQLAAAKQSQLRESRFYRTELSRLRDLDGLIQQELNANVGKLERTSLLWANQKVELGEMLGAVTSTQHTLERRYATHKQFWSHYAQASLLLAPTDLP